VVGKFVGFIVEFVKSCMDKVGDIEGSVITRSNSEGEIDGNEIGFMLGACGVDVGTYESDGADAGRFDWVKVGDVDDEKVLVGGGDGANEKSEFCC
jgi:hypothetical protein